LHQYHRVVVDLRSVTTGTRVTLTPRASCNTAANCRDCVKCVKHRVLDFSCSGRALDLKQGSGEGGGLVCFLPKKWHYPKKLPKLLTFGYLNRQNISVKVGRRTKISPYAPWGLIYIVKCYILTYLKALSKNYGLYHSIYV
jgi:hypothetical protein